jgi:hypothetical protein
LQQLPSSSRRETVQQGQIQQLVSSLGLKRGSEVPRRSRKQSSGDFELPWSSQQSQPTQILDPETPSSSSSSSSNTSDMGTATMTLRSPHETEHLPCNSSDLFL